MSEALDQMLDELIANAIHYHFEDNNSMFKITISYTIKVPPLDLLRSSVDSTAGSIRWHELIRALILLDMTHEKLRPLQRGLTRQLLQPLIQHHSNTVLQFNGSESYTSAKESSISIELKSGHGPGRVSGLIWQEFILPTQKVLM
jgi:light-regulated signal transduction histidine kinase (bacteriophytochrome)